MPKTIVVGVQIGGNGNFIKFSYDFDAHDIRFENGRLKLWHIERDETRLIVPESNVLFVEIEGGAE